MANVKNNGPNIVNSAVVPTVNFIPLDKVANRAMLALGHLVKVISPQYIKSFVRRQRMTAMTRRRSV
jgi:hypothetical protein